MADKPAKTSAPTNGHAINSFLDNITKPANIAAVDHVDIAKALPQYADAEHAPKLAPATKDAMKVKFKLPSKLYRHHFSGKSLSPEQMLRRSINTTAKAIPQSVVGLLHKKIKGATTRINHRKIELQKYRMILKTGEVVKNGKNVALTPSEMKAHKQKKLQVHAELISAMQDLLVYRTDLNEAIKKNATPVKDTMKAVREMAHIRRMTPSIAQQIADSFAAHSELKDQLLNLKNDPAREEVANTFLNIVKESDSKAYKIISAKPKLATQVRQAVFDKLFSTK